MAERTKIITPEFRLSFPYLFEPRANDKGDKFFEIVMLFPKTLDLSILRNAVKAAAMVQWPDEKARPAKLDLPFRDGDEKALDGYAGHFSVRAKSKNKPGVVDEAVKAVLDRAGIYAGCYCRAALTCYAWTNTGKHGVSFGLLNVQKLRNGEPFGAHSDPEDDFTAVAKQATPVGAGASAVPTGTAADSDFWK